MKNKMLFVSIAVLLAVLLNACAGTAVEETPTQPVVSTEVVPSVAATQNETAQGTPRQEERTRKLDAAAEALGVTVEELQAAFQAAIPPECAVTEGQPKKRDPNCRADFNKMAETLGVTVGKLREVLGENKRADRNKQDLTSAAETLGVSVEELQAAFQAALPPECAATESQPKKRDPNCRADLNKMAETLGVPVEELQAVIGHNKRENQLDSAAETLGVTVEELQAAFQAARPPECTATNGQPKQPNPNCQADLNKMAETLGVTVEELQAVIDHNRSGLAAAAETLGVTEDELRAALDASKPVGCATTGGQPVVGQNCRPDLTIAAKTLGVTVEDLQAALGRSKPSQQPPAGGTTP